MLQCKIMYDILLVQSQKEHMFWLQMFITSIQYTMHPSVWPLVTVLGYKVCLVFSINDSL